MYTYIYIHVHIYIYIYYKLEEGAFLSKRFLLSDDFGFLVSSFPPCSIISEILRRSSVLIIVGAQ